MKNVKKLFALFAIVVLALSGACSRQLPVMQGEMQRKAPWSPGFVEQMRSLELQDNGRTKPLMTVASFLLYRVHGRRDLRFEVGGQPVKLDPTEWLLDVWCFPEQAANYPLFRIENVGVMDELGIENDGQTLDFQYLSYNQLLAKAERLQKQAADYERIDAAQRSAVQEHVVQTYRQLIAYHRVHRQFEPLHHPFALEGDALRGVFGGKDKVLLGEFLAQAKAFRAFVQASTAANPNGGANDPRLGNTFDLIQVLQRVVELGSGLGLFPPPAGEEEWYGLGEPLDRALRGEDIGPYGAMFSDLQGAAAATEASVREASLLHFRDAVGRLATERGVHGKGELEAYYYVKSWAYQAIHWFLFAFLVAAVAWLLPRNRILWWGAFGLTALACGMLCFDITLRCIITERPPIKNLYDTFLFIAAVAVITLLVVECILPRRIALALAPLAGAVLVMFARMFEVADGKDTMDPLVAVLDSNYWLATHVTMINTGYGAGLAAMLIANVWFGARMFGEPKDGSFCKAMVRMVYGVTSFSLIFTVVGTIWGGVWANDSWGRFWGWDPKENGALLICLAQVALLHARFSGLVRDRGFMIWTGFTGMVVTFSWFHTNLLGIGLHNYGFSTGLRDAVWTVYTGQCGWMGLSGLVCLVRSLVAGPATPPPLPAESA